MTPENEPDPLHETLVHWENARREQLTGVITLVFGLSVGALAFCGSLLTEETVTLGGGRTVWFLLAVVAFIAAVAFSFAVTFTRLADTRVTTRIVRAKRSEDPQAKAALVALRQESREWGNWSFCWFYWQHISFGLGAIFLLIALWLIFHAKLFPPAC
jgi:hypothetical protein